MCLHLPDEIWLGIFSYLNLGCSDKHLLRHLSPCSKQLHRLCAPFLWATISAKCIDPDGICHLIALINKRQYIAGSIKEIHLSTQFPHDVFIAGWPSPTIPKSFLEYVPAEWLRVHLRIALSRLPEVTWDYRKEVMKGSVPALISLLVHISRARILSFGVDFFKAPFNKWKLLTRHHATVFEHVDRIIVHPNSCYGRRPLTHSLEGIRCIDFVMGTWEGIRSEDFFDDLRQLCFPNQPERLEELCIRYIKIEGIRKPLRNLQAFTGLNYLQIPFEWLFTYWEALDPLRTSSEWEISATNGLISSLPPNLRILGLSYVDSSPLNIALVREAITRLLKAPWQVWGKESTLESIELLFTINRVSHSPIRSFDFDQVLKAAVQRSPPIDVTVVRLMYGDYLEGQNTWPFSRMCEEIGVFHSTALWKQGYHRERDDSNDAETSGDNKLWSDEQREWPPSDEDGFPDLFD